MGKIISAELTLIPVCGCILVNTVSVGTGRKHHEPGNVEVRQQIVNSPSLHGNSVGYTLTSSPGSYIEP